MVILLNALSIFHQNLLNAKSIFTHQSTATISHKRRDMPSACFQCADTLPIASKHFNAKALKISKMNFQSRWKRRIVVNSMQARLRAQLGDWSISSVERRRRSVVVVPNSPNHNRPSPRLDTVCTQLLPSYASLRLRRQDRLHGVSHHAASSIPTPPLISVSPMNFPQNRYESYTVA